MNGAHDMGGMQGNRPVVPEPDEPVFHAEWERRAFALTLAMGFHGRWNIDMSRFAREDWPPADYLARSYFQMWLAGLEKLLVQKGFVTEAELDGSAPPGGPAMQPPVSADRVEGIFRKGGTARIDAQIAAKFKAGDRVTVRNAHPRGHTRAPRYVRGRTGMVARDHGVFIFPDSHAASGDQSPQHCYAVRFRARDLWGADAAAADSVCVDLWDDYLDPAP